MAWTNWLAHGKDYTLDVLADKTFNDTVTFMDGTTMLIGDKTFETPMITNQSKNTGSYTNQNKS